MQEQKIDWSLDEYLNPTPDRSVDQKLLDHISDWVIAELPVGRLLELGVGDQVWTPKLLKKFPEVTSIDASSELLEAMKRRVNNPRWSYEVCFFENYTPAALFDVVLISYVLEHVDDPSVIVERAFHWIRPGGHLAVVVPHALSLHRRLAVKIGLQKYPAELGDTDRRMGHKRVFICYEMEKMLSDAGFQVLDRRGLLTKLLPNRLMVDLSNQLLRGIVELALELPIEYSSAIYFLGQKPQ